MAGTPARLIPPDEIPGIWHDVRERVQRGLRRATGWHERDVLAALLLEQMQLWRNGPAIAVTRICNYPRERFCEVFLVSGADLGSWYEKDCSALCAWAKERGCTSMQAFGRVGLAKKLPDWETKYVVMRKTL